MANKPTLFFPKNPQDPQQQDPGQLDPNYPSPTSKPSPEQFVPDGNQDYLGQQPPAPIAPMQAASTETQPAPPVVADQANAGGPTSNAPAAPFYTSLKLTPERETEMTTRALRRIDELKREMGLDAANRVQPKTWMDRRWRNDMSYNNDLTWRTAIGGVFQKSNLSLHTNTRHTRYLSAVIQRDLLGTNPFFAVMGKNPDKQELARQVEEYVQGEVDRTNVRSGLRSASKIALYRDECVVKVTYRQQASPFFGPATVLVDSSGNPVRTPEQQLYVDQDMQFVPSPDAQGVMVLMDDPSFMVHQGDILPPDTQMIPPGKYGWKLIESLNQMLSTYEGVSVDPVDWRCFLCPLRVDDIGKADINVHLYKEEPGNLRKRFSDVDVSQNYFGWWDQTGDKQANLIQGELAEVPSIILEQITVAECYMRWDADEDGYEEELFLVIDYQSKRVIFYDYLANHMDRRPFVVIPGLERVPDRWYGRGIFSLGEDQELHMDTEFNRAQLRGSRSSVVTFRHKVATKEWQAGLPTVFGGESVYDLEGKEWNEKNPPIFKVNLTEQNDKALELMEVSRQASDALIGAISVKDASQAEMNQSKTATGIVNMQEATDVLVAQTEVEQGEAMDHVLELVISTVLKNCPKAVLTLNKDATKLVSLSPQKIRSLDRDVRLLLTKSRSTQLLSASQQAIQIGKDFRQLMIQDMMGARLFRPLYLSALKALEVDDADDVIPEITDDMIAQQQQQQANQASRPPNQSIAIKYSDLERSEQEQELKRVGINPAPAAEVAASRAREDQQAKPNGTLPA